MFFSILLVTTSAALAQEKVDLRLRFAKDDVQSMTVTLEQTIDQTVHDKPERLSQRITTGYTMKVENVDEHGQATVSLRYDSQAYHMTSGTSTIDFDSTQPGTVEPQVAAPLAALIGQSYTFTISAEGQITRVTGLGKLADQVVSKLTGVDGPARLATERVIRAILSEAGVKATLQNLFAPFPDHPVAVGESWPHTTQINSVIPLTLETTCTLKSRDNGVATIEISGHYSTPANSTMELGQTKFTCEFQGDTRGRIEVQESTGWTVGSTTTQSLAGAATTKSPVDTQSIPIKVDSTLKAERH
jgi:hypothetical protein